MEPITYIIYGDPIPLARARHGNRRTWDSQKQLKLCVGIELARQHKGKELYQGPLFFEVTFFMPIPKSFSQKKQLELIGRYHTVKPDASNLLKLVEDIASDILYKDDALIAQIHCRKVYDARPRTEFKITSLKEYHAE